MFGVLPLAIWCYNFIVMAKIQLFIEYAKEKGRKFNP